MPMPPYPIYCYTKGCKNQAAYKIAARWSDGKVSELKTYGLVCADCLPDWYRKTLQKQQDSHLAPHEELDRAGIYQLERGSRDQKLKRLDELERSMD